MTDDTQKYKEIIDYLPVGVYENTPGVDGVFLEINPAMLKIFEAEPSQLINQKVSNIYQNPLKRKAFSDKLLQNKVLYNELLEFKTFKGKKIWGSVTAIVKNDENGQIFFYGIIEDVTRQKNYEEKLIASERKFHAIFDTTFQFIGLLSLDGILLEANKSALEFAGIKPSDVIGKPFWEGPWWSHSKEAQNNLKAAIKRASNGEFVRFETTHPSKTGTIEYVDFSLKPAFDENGKVIFLVPEGRQITDLKLAEAIYKNIFENVPEAIVEVNFSDLKNHIDQLQASGINDLDLFLKTNRREIFICLEKIHLNKVNQSFLKLFEAKSKEEYLLSSSHFLGIENLDVIKEIIIAIAKNQENFRAEIETITLKKNKIELIFQYSISPGTNDFSKTLISLSDITKQKEIERQLAYASAHDPLTGLPNRILFDEVLTSSLARAKRSSKKVALFYMDIDFFKNVNDTFGHVMGDSLLIKIGARLKSMIRADDFVARIGGDEFVVIINSVNEMNDASIIAKKILAKINGEYNLGDSKVVITFSIGIALFPDATSDINDLKKYADIALYSVKNSGRNNFRFYLAPNDFISRSNMEKEFIFAFENQQLYLMYQPKYNIKNNNIYGLEALIRWQHEHYGLVFPENFIPYAEEQGLIGKIGKWVIENACAQYMGWFKNIKPNEYKPKLEINLSFQQLLQKDFISTLEQILKTTNMDPNDLEFEISEKVIIGNGTYLSILQDLTHLGVHISIDDLNRNISELEIIKKFPVTTLKISQSIISDILSNVSNSEIARTIIDFGVASNIDVIAIGVENKAQVNYLIDIGCFIQQGYYLCKPLRANEIPGVLLSSVNINM